MTQVSKSLCRSQMFWSSYSDLIYHKCKKKCSVGGKHVSEIFFRLNRCCFLFHQLVNCGHSCQRWFPRGILQHRKGIYHPVSQVFFHFSRLKKGKPHGVGCLVLTDGGGSWLNTPHTHTTTSALPPRRDSWPDDGHGKNESTTGCCSPSRPTSLS